MSATTRDFLVELGTEELPPLALPELERAFADGIRSRLTDAELAFAGLESFATPRRLAVRVNSLTLEQPAQEIRLKGPPVGAAFDSSGAPTAAANKFAEKCGVAVSALGRVQEGKGEFLFFAGSKPGAATMALLPGFVQQALEQLPIPKRMRWGSSDAEFVRPVHWLVMLFGSDIIECRILDTDAGNQTRGHRFHAPGPIAIERPADYEHVLRERGHVLASFQARRAKIRAQVAAQGKELGGAALLDDDLLDEVTALVEWPTPVAGQFEERFLELPREVLISTLQEHQRYFPTQRVDGSLLPWFITVSNIESRDPSKVRHGNERVVRPRLSDAAFFWAQDRKQPLAARRGGLDAVTFQAKLGSLGDKTERVRQLVAVVAPLVGANRARAERAATLAKCDLLSAMVGEFPELQGIMGRHYAAADGEPADIAAAIDEHYQPRGAGGALPSTAVGTALAIADKLDTLAGIFSIGQKPSGTKDPFALRRAAIGLVRLIIEKQLDIDLRGLIERAVTLQPVKQADAAREVQDYVSERLRSYLLEGDSAAVAGATAEMFDAVQAAAPSSPLDFRARLAALAEFVRHPDAASLAAANKRTANILKKSAAASSNAGVRAALLREPAEKALQAALDLARAPVAAAIAKRDYAGALATLAKLRPEVDAFFDSVMVNDPDTALRDNRLALLGSLRDAFAGVADLSRLPG
jgi:glycyl-tRNA synthetase beta chain